MGAKFRRPEEGEPGTPGTFFFPAAIKQGRGSRGSRRALPLPAAAAPSRLQVGAGFAQRNPGSVSFPPVPHPSAWPPFTAHQSSRSLPPSRTGAEKRRPAGSAAAPLAR